MKRDIKDLSYLELQGWLTSINEPRYRAGQIFLWLYQKRVDSFKSMKNLPVSLIGKLEDNFSILLPEIVKKQVSRIDGTVKYLLELADSELIETVLIPSDERLTACLSSQVGCRYRCRFCASGMYGFRRNLTQAEILSQLIIIKEKLTNIVFMGIGEPLDNYNNVIGAIKIINDRQGFNLGARRITISTAGMPEKIKGLAKIGLQIELSVSLHAADNKKRDMLMPINKIYPLDRLLKALKEYKRIITFEYIVIKDINDSAEDMNKLIKLLDGIRCKVNLIPFSPVNPVRSRPAEGTATTALGRSASNGVKELPYKSPERKDVLIFRDLLVKAGIPATVRRSMGADISAACGQLRIGK